MLLCLRIDFFERGALKTVALMAAGKPPDYHCNKAKVNIAAVGEARRAVLTAS